jgi:DNA-directed RNA polymerase specialized sigma24 family protein
MPGVPALRLHSDRAFARLHRRYVGSVYRYAFAVLHHEADAEAVAQTTFANAYRTFQLGSRPPTPDLWLLAIAHELCRRRCGGLAADAELRTSPEGVRLWCLDAERVISRLADGRLARPERAALHAHVRSCRDCACLVRGVRVQRSAFKNLAAVPVPESLTRPAQVSLRSGI